MRGPSRSSFTALPNAVIPLASISALKEYLLLAMPLWRGLPVERYVVSGDAIKARLVFPDGTRAWSFVGCTDEVAKNVQSGTYEPDRRYGD